jgi:hypothetical protein
MVTPSQPMPSVPDSPAATPLAAGVSMALAVSVVLANRVGFAPFRNGSWRAVETPPPSM